jgi:membrane-associated phospholipid phosphatase
MRISCLRINFLVCSAAFLSCNCLAISQNSEIAVTSKEQSAFQSKTNQNRILNQEQSANFYKTDSIFSLRSPKGYIPSLLYDFGEQATAPLRFKCKDWLITGATAGITTALIFIDGDIDEWARTLKERHNWINISSPIITKLGGNPGIYSVAAFGLLSAAFQNNKGVQTSLLATQAMITSGIWGYFIKMLTGRERPEAAYLYSQFESGKWYGPFSQFNQDLTANKTRSAFDAFPSGHAATAFSIATVFATQYRDKKAIPIISYSVASLVGISRITEHKHWSSDVFAGALLGYVCGKQVVAHYNKTHQNPDNSLSLKSQNKTELTFIQNGNQIGLFLKW